jgi:RNA polymerase primary sigma factor
VVRLYFGLDGIPCHTLSEVGKCCHLTGERVRQVKQRALRKLRSYSRFHAVPATVYHNSIAASAVS